MDVDKERGRISLSIKATQPGPWESVAEKISVGDEIKGTIRRLTDFGAFVEVLPGVEGLIHVSQISWDRVNKPSDVLKVGQEVQVKVLNVDPEKHRLGLSIKALIDNPHASKKQKNEQTAEPTDYSLPDEERGFSVGDMIDTDKLKK